MAALSIQVPYPVFYDRDGDPLDNGNIYIGVANLDPVTNPIQVYFDEALTIPASQPLKTSNGYIYRNGTPAQLYVNGANFSIMAKDANGALIYSFPDGTGISPNASGIIYNEGSIGAVDRTVENRLQDRVSVKDFGAVGDGIADDTAAIQAAIDAFKPTAVDVYGLPDQSKNIYVPEGVYRVTAPINVYSGITLFGDGSASTLKADAALTTQILDLTATINGQCRWVSIYGMNFEGAGTVRAIKSSAGLFLNSIIRDNTFNIGYCIDLNIGGTYTQSVTILRNVSAGNLDQFLAISGNRNLLEDFVKEGGVGASADPLVYIKDCDSLLIRNCLIEGAGTAIKLPFKIENSTANIYQMWFEINNTNGYSIEFINSQCQIFGDFRFLQLGIRKLKASNNTRLYMDYYADDGEDDGLSKTLEIDSTSSVIIDQYRGRRFQNLYQLSRLKSQLRVNRSQISTGTPANGYLRDNSVKYIGGNRLINPSFEAGVYGWTFDAAPITFAVQPSEVSTGLMARLTWGGAGSRKMTQSIVIDAAQIGVPMTFTGMIKIVSGDPSAWGSITATGAGLVPSGSDGFMTFARINEGWQLVSQTFTPLAAGTLNVGFAFFNTIEALVDNASFGYGVDGEPDRSTFGSVELNQRTFTTAAAAPTVGTWKVGDRVFNSAPVVGQPKSWVCTVAGTPGTWTSEGNL